MFDMVSACGIGMLDNINEELIVDEYMWFDKTLIGITRFSELKIINNLTFMFKELYIIGEEEEFVFSIDRIGTGEYEIHVPIRDTRMVEAYLTDIEENVRRSDKRIRRVSILMDETCVTILIRE